MLLGAICGALIEVLDIDFSNRLGPLSRLAKLSALLKLPRWLHRPYNRMPKEHKKRGRREEKKRKRHEEEDDYVEATKCQRFHDGEYGVEEVADHQEAIHGENPTTYDRPSSLPFYGLLDEGEQEYFKRADSLLELNQFDNEDDRSLFLANVYKEANGKELKIASSQSCSRLMERLILLSTSDQLKGLFEKFSGQ